MARVVELRYYPVKGCAGVSVSEGLVTPAGLAHDRAFMVTDQDGGFRTQRRDPRLAVVRPTVSTDGTELTLHAPGAGAVRVPVDLTGPRRPVVLFKTVYGGIDQGDEVAAWLTDVFGAPRRLVRVPPEHDRVTDGAIPGTSGYADSCAIHVLSVASLRELNARLAEPLPVSRFRPNLVVDGWTAHQEDDERLLTIGDVELGFAKAAVRCAVTLVDQEAGAKAGPEPLRTLSRYRRTPQGGVTFGAKFAVLRAGKLAVGDEVVSAR
jgi:hypothetical protein